MRLGVELKVDCFINACHGFLSGLVHGQAVPERMTFLSVTFGSLVKLQNCDDFVSIFFFTIPKILTGSLQKGFRSDCGGQHDESRSV